MKAGILAEVQNHLVCAWLEAELGIEWTPLWRGVEHNHWEGIFSSEVDSAAHELFG